MTNLPARLLSFFALSALCAFLVPWEQAPWERSQHSAGSMHSEFELAAPASDDRQAHASLQSLAGCFAVRYQFTEDGRRDFFFDDGVEYMDIKTVGDGYLARNYLVYDGYTFLHWVQEWQPLAGGRWLLTVKDGAGALRYQSDGVWRFNQWESQPAVARKPTRDELRDDYQQLLRRNIIQFTEGRWVQSEINLKQTAEGTPVASEVGWITYTLRDDDTPCRSAMEVAREQ